MIILTILVTIQNKQSKINHTIWLNHTRIFIFASAEEKVNERLSELKTWLLSCSYPLAIIEKTFFNAKMQRPAPKKEDILIPFVSAHYSSFDSESIFITANSLLSNVKDKKLRTSIWQV